MLHRLILRLVAAATLLLLLCTASSSPTTAKTPTLLALAAPVRRAAAIDPRAPLAASWNSKGNSYPIVFLHGLLGWGDEPLLRLLNYWGGITTNILDVLRDKGYEVYAPSMGPVSSNWERACEAYAQLVGARVDYGLARAARFNHSRFGRDFSQSAPLVPSWTRCADCKIHLVGHSMGGPTIRALAHLMAHGSQPELDACAAAGVPCSPLFWTNRTSSYIEGVFTVAGATQGSAFDEYLFDHGLFKDFVLDLVKLLVAATGAVEDLTPALDLWDFQLGHWGLDPQPGEPLVAYVDRLLSDSRFASSDSTALYDLSVSAARSDPFLAAVRNAQDVTYLSVAALTTFNFFGRSYARPSTFPLLIPTANIVGSYSNKALGIAGGDWRPNDGLVSLISARGDAVEGYVDYPLDLEGSVDALVTRAVNRPVRGKFSYVGSTRDDHISSIAVLDLVKGRKNQEFLNMAGILASL
ncbi:Alpha/Beta hydrolase protein [Zopfochytrium polystomum]|nr:Alpha/Beta hydrolase protein [Zopfochytrium polystomum]